MTRRYYFVRAVALLVFLAACGSQPEPETAAEPETPVEEAVETEEPEEEVAEEPEPEVVEEPVVVAEVPAPPPVVEATPARTLRPVTSTGTEFMAPRSMTSPPSQVAFPATLCPPLRTATSRSCSRAKLTASITSATPVHWAMSAGCLSTEPFQMIRAAS